MLKQVKHRPPSTGHRSPNTGFTLIELLVVVGIIGILASAVLANFNATRVRARDVQRKADLGQLRNALQLFHNDYDQYPASGSDDRIAGCGVAANQTCSWGSAWRAGPAGQEITYMGVTPVDPLADRSDQTDPLHYAYASPGPDDFILTALLENASDEDIAESQTNCGSGSGTQYVVCD